jgi:gliding motility-associated-like protein
MPDGSQVNTTGPYQYVAQTIWGCDSIIDINLTVKPQPVITASNDTLLNCTATTVILSATSSVTNTNFTWTGGATGSSLNVNTPNTYTVTGNADGCISSAVVIVTIDTLKPNVNAGVDRILTCSDTLFELLATSTTSNVSFAWSNTASTPNTTITSPNTYTVTATDTTNGCSSTDAAVVSQNITPPSVSLGPNRSLTCSVLSINLVPQTNAIISDYEWSTSVQTPTINVNSPNVYSVTVISAINGCSGSASITIDEASRPQAFFNAGDNPCIDVSKGFIETNIVGGVAPFTFNWSNGSILSSIYGIKGGVYTIYIRDSNGCVVDTVISIVNGEFLIDAYESTTINLGDEAQILTQIAGGSGSYDLVWSPKRYLDCYTCDNVTSGALQNITYTVLATDTNGCRATDTVTITVNPEYPLYVPNAFTPNNDGFNDFFEIFGNKKIWLTMTIRIFNRWGELVFETSDQKFRWDGRYKGELLTPQVLTYVLDVDYVNGVKEKAVKGSLTLIK